MVMSTPKPSRPPLEQLVPSPEQNGAVAGELWTIKRDGEDWPVVICDEEIVWTFFKGRVRPFNARQADGTWPEDYKPGGTRVCQRSYPAVILGQLRFTWVSRKILEGFDKEVGQVIQASTTNSLLARGWNEAMRLYALEDPLPELKKTIRQQRLGRGGPKAPTGSDDVEKIKRKGTPLFKYPPSPRVEEVDDEEPEDLLVRQESGTGQKIKKEPGDLASFADMGVCERSTDLTRSNSEQPNKKSRLDALGRSSMRLSTPLRAATQGLSSRNMSTSRGTPASSLKKEVDDPTKVKIYVGNPHTAFMLRRNGLDASPLLSKMVCYDPDNGLYIMSPALSKLDKVNFMPVGQYLERGEYDPNILDEGTEWVRLETNVSGQDAGEELMRCAIIYDIARTLELPGLQDLAFRKLKALAKNEPHQPFAILCVVDHVFRDAKSDMRQYLVDYLAEHLWDLVRQENKKVAEVMEADEDLSKRVFGLLAGLPEAEVKKEGEGRVKAEESFGEDKGELELGSPATLVGNEAEGGLIGKGTSQESTTPYPATITTGTDRDTTAEKEKAEKDTAKRMTAKELLTSNDALVDNAATTLSATNETVSFSPPEPATTTAHEIEERLRQEEGELIKSAANKSEGGLSQEDQEMIRMAIKEADAQIAEEAALQQQADVVGTSADDDRKGWERMD